VSFLIQHLEAAGADLYLDAQNVDTTSPMGRLLSGPKTQYRGLWFAVVLPSFKNAMTSRPRASEYVPW